VPVRHRILAVDAGGGELGVVAVVADGVAAPSFLAGEGATPA